MENKDAQDTGAAEAPEDQEQNVPLNREERRHGAKANQQDRSMPGKRGSFNNPFQGPAPGQKKNHSHRKTG